MTASAAPGRGAAAGPAPPDAAERARRTAAWLCAAVAVVALVPAVTYGFVYDDHRFLAENPHLADPSVLWRAFTDPACQTADGTHAGLWRPLRTLSFALDRAAFGASPAGPHAVNVLLHGIGTWCVARLLAAWRLPAAAVAFGAAFYAVHPVQVECVAWISSRGDLLAAAFVWAALLADLRGSPRAALALGAAALLSKEQAVVWPALVVLSGLAAGRGRAAFRAAALPAAATAVYVAVRFLLPSEPLQQGGLGAEVTSAQGAAMLAHQTAAALLPVRSAFDWQMPRLTSLPWEALPPLALLVWGLARNATRVAALWFVAALVPTLFLQFVVPLNILVADRFLLFALPAAALLVGGGVTTGRAARFPLALVVLCLFVRTRQELPVWRSDESLWSRTAERVPGHWRANLWLGIGAVRAGRMEESEPHLVRAVESNPADAQSRYYLAAAQEAVGKARRDDDRIWSALQNYRIAVAAFAGPRAEGRDALLEPARWAVADLLLLSGEKEAARAAIEALLAEPRTAAPRDPALVRRAAGLAERAEVHLDSALARRIRDRWELAEPEDGGR